MDDLSWSSEFSSLLLKQTEEDRSEFADARKRLASAKQIVRKVRDKLSGHILPQEVQKGIERFEYGMYGIVEVGPTLERTHYKFAGEIVAAMLSTDVDTAEAQLEQLRNDFEKIGHVVPVVGVIDKIIAWYADDRDLI